MRTQIFTYKGMIGMVVPENPEGVIAEPGGGNLGYVLRTDKCDITKEAKEVFKKARREGGSFAPFMLTVHAGQATEAHGRSSFGWLGGNRNAAEFKEVLIGRDCDLSALDDMNLTETEAPEDFKQFVDAMI